MGWYRRNLFGVWIVSGLVGVSLSARAEEPASPSSNILSEIVVTAEKRTEKLQDVPIAVTVVKIHSMLKLQRRKFPCGDLRSSKVSALAGRRG